MRFRKGQVEFVAIAAIILIALIVVILALQQTAVTPPEDTGIFEEAKTVKDSVNNLIKTGLKEQMMLIYNQGGMLNPPEGGYNSVDFVMFKVPVWQACDQISIPDVAEQIEYGIGDYLRKNLKTEEEFAKKRVTFDFSKIDIDVDIFKDNIRVRINLPTTIENYNIPQPYEVSVQTKLYDILEFSENFVKDHSIGRVIEGALIRCINKFPTDPGSGDWLRMTGVLTGCGERIFKTRSDLLPSMKKAIGTSVSQILWNVEQPLRSVDRNCLTPINIVGGKAYPGLNVYFEYPQSWNSRLNQNFFFSPNPVNFVAAPLMPFIPVCVAPLYVAYSVTYPVVIMVEDSLNPGHTFNFAVMADVADNLPGNCSFEIGEVETDYIEICVSGANRYAKVTVKDTEGNPIEGADVTVDICDVGRTDINGVINGSIPSGLVEIHVYKTGYRSYGDFLDASEIEDITVELTKIQENITLHFNGVPLDCQNPLGGVELDCTSYTVESSPQPITSLGDLTIFSTFLPKDTSIFGSEECNSDIFIPNYVNESPVDTMVFEGLCPNNFDVSTFVTRNFEIMMGYMDSNLTLGETDKDVYIYVPVVLTVQGVAINDSVGQDESEQLTTVLKNCGIEPVSTSMQIPNCV